MDTLPSISRRRRGLFNKPGMYKPSPSLIPLPLLLLLPPSPL